MVILLGKTCSGKTTIQNQLFKYGFHPMITYTTRPIRNGEIQDKSYHFITDTEFLKKIKDNFFLEHKTYNTVEGVWRYGSAKQDYENSDWSTIVVLTPDGYRDFIKAYPDKQHISIYVYTSRSVLRQRLIDRGDAYQEASRRLNNDNMDFNGVEGLVHKIVYNNGYRKDLGVVIEEILYAIKKKRNEYEKTLS